MNLGELHDGEDGDGGFNVQVFYHKMDYKGPVNIHISSKLDNDALGYLTARNNLIGISINDLSNAFIKIGTCFIIFDGLFFFYLWTRLIWYIKLFFICRRIGTC